jgi:hypothetical protein
MNNATKTVEPAIGMGATIIHFSDRTACTIVGIKSFKTGAKAGTVRQIVLQRDIATRIDGNGMCDSQKYRYERDPNGILFTARPKDGQLKVGSSPIVIDYREEYFDYSF